MNKTEVSSEPLFQLERVDWFDSEGPLGWNAAQKRCQPALIQSIGWVVNESDTAISLASHVDGYNECYHSQLTIPKCAITQRNVIDND